MTRTTELNWAVWATSVLVLLGAGSARAEGIGVPKPRLKPVAPMTIRAAPELRNQAVAGVDAAQACLASLRELGADIGSEQPIETERGCAIANPVKLSGVRSGDHRVVLDGTPVLKCRFAVRLARWFGDVVSPLARHHLGSPVARFHVGPGYACRGRNGSRTGKLSEHAFGNGIDILGLTLAGGGKVMMVEDPEARGPKKAFFQAMRTSACGYFTTVLGPGADEAHADHVHVDLGRHGKTDNYRICQ